MAERSRTYNSILNSIFGILSSAVTVILNFFVRVVLVRELGEEVNGLHNLFYSITNVIVLMELGIGSAMIIHLYEPVKLKDEYLIKAILGYYKKIYGILAIVFFIVSLLIDILFIDNIITTNIGMNVVRLYFLLFIISYVVNYLTYYKRSLLFAEQKNRISTATAAACEVFFRTLQIVSIIVYHNYYIFLILAIAEKFTCNLICSIYINKYHPYLRTTKYPELDTEKKKSIFNTVKPLMINQTANTIQQSSQGILISMLLGNVSIVGYFGNYNLLIGMVQLVFSQFGGAFTSSFGNLAVDANHSVLKTTYLRSSFLIMWLASISCAGFVACADDFIYFVFGENYVLDRLSVLILTLYMLIYLISIPMISIQNAMGLHRLDSRNMIIQAILAIVLGYLGGTYYGMPGIFMGLLIPYFFITYIMKGLIIAVEKLHMSRIAYIKHSLVQLLKISATVVLALLTITNMPFTPSLASIIIKGLTALIIGIFIPLLLSRNTDELKYSMSLIKKMIKK